MMGDDSVPEDVTRYYVLLDGNRYHFVAVSPKKKQGRGTLLCLPSIVVRALACVCVF